MLDLDLRLCILGTTSEPFGDPEKCFWGLFVPVRQGGRALALTGPQAIGAVFGVVLAHEVTADDGQMISHVWDRLMQRAPITTIAGTIGFATVTVAHLLNALDRHPRLDPYAGFGFAVIRRADHMPRTQEASQC